MNEQKQRIVVMKQVSVTTLFVLLCVGLTHTAAEDDQFKLVLHHIDLLRLQVQLLQSRKLRALTRCFILYCFTTAYYTVLLRMVFTNDCH